jgi:hypothetical protein
MIDRDATGICKRKAEENGMKEEVYGSFTSFRPRARPRMQSGGGVRRPACSEVVMAGEEVCRGESGMV